METVVTILSLACFGLRDCFNGVILALTFFWKTRNDSPPKASKTKRHEGSQKTVFQVLVLCLVFGALYSSAIFIFDNYFLQFVVKFWTSFLTPDEDYYYWWCSTICSIQFNICWTFTLFFLSRILTYSWYQEVADLTCAKLRMKTTNQQSLSYVLSDQINSAITQSFFLVQAYVVYLFPLPWFIKDSVYVFHLSLLYALYAFEYKWIQKGYDMNWRLSYVEAKWPYFMGFGLPLSAVTFFIGSYIHSICVFSSVFPFYVMSSTMTCANQLKTFNQPLKVFKVVSMTSDLLVGGVIEKVSKVLKK